MPDATPSPDTPDAVVYGEGDTDIIVPLVPERLWLALLEASYLDGTSGVLWQLSWGAGTDDEPDVDDQVMFSEAQMRYLSDTYRAFHEKHYGES